MISTEDGQQMVPVYIRWVGLNTVNSMGMMVDSFIDNISAVNGRSIRVTIV